MIDLAQSIERRVNYLDKALPRRSGPPPRTMAERVEATMNLWQRAKAGDAPSITKVARIVEILKNCQRRQAEMKP